MRVRLEVGAVLRVSDQAGRIVREEPLPAGTDLHERLRIAHENDARPGWAVGELAPGQWAFVAQKRARRWMIAIRDSTQGRRRCRDRTDRFETPPVLSGLIREEDQI